MVFTRCISIFFCKVVKEVPRECEARTDRSNTLSLECLLNWRKENDRLLDPLEPGPEAPRAPRGTFARFQQSRSADKNSRAARGRRSEPGNGFCCLKQTREVTLAKTIKAAKRTTGIIRRVTFKCAPIQSIQTGIHFPAAK